MNDLHSVAVRLQVDFPVVSTPFPPSIIEAIRNSLSFLPLLFLPTQE